MTILTIVFLSIAAAAILEYLWYLAGPTLTDSARAVWKWVKK